MGWDQKEPWGGGSAGVAKRRCSGTASTNKLVLPPLQGGCVYRSTRRRQQQSLQIEIDRRQCNLNLLTAVMVPRPFAVEPGQRLFVGEGLVTIILWPGMV
ncbi:uncharacterized protein An02g12240 [Aspergillus niger]|uniref:Contig An02c0390, genomic contig n=2 Tax=Aspergillus niger TaxID=5061 RepID=A2QEU1_ASPNC|nr:uncharacterized protein An02g12240 [Aspergillus niger]CAK37905.1 unnamed protein product [Aspergillus niger]